MRIAPALALSAAWLAGGCVAGGSLHREARPAPVFDPAVFFTGRSEGHGRLSIMTRHTHQVVVQSNGRMAPDGTLVLDQAVSDDGKPAKMRQWRLRQDGPGRWQGTLSDAAGPVSGEVSGNRLHLAFPIKGGLHAQQWLYLQPDGRTVRNRMVVRKFGLPVASLTETIVKTAD